MAKISTYFSRSYLFSHRNINFSFVSILLHLAKMCGFGYFLPCDHHSTLSFRSGYLNKSYSYSFDCLWFRHMSAIHIISYLRMWNSIMKHI